MLSIGSHEKIFVILRSQKDSFVNFMRIQNMINRAVNKIAKSFFSLKNVEHRTLENFV